MRRRSAAARGRRAPARPASPGAANRGAASRRAGSAKPAGERGEGDQRAAGDGDAREREHVGAAAACSWRAAACSDRPDTARSRSCSSRRRCWRRAASGSRRAAGFPSVSRVDEDARREADVEAGGRRSEVGLVEVAGGAVRVGAVEAGEEPFAVAGAAVREPGAGESAAAPSDGGERTERAAALRVCTASRARRRATAARMTSAETLTSSASPMTAPSSTARRQRCAPSLAR